MVPENAAAKVDMNMVVGTGQPGQKMTKDMKMAMTMRPGEQK